MKMIPPLVEADVSGRMLDASANRVVKYTAQMTLSAASPAVNTDGDTLRALATET